MAVAEIEGIMADPLVIDYIELNAKGITDIKAELDRLKESEDAAREAHEKLVKSLEDPAQAKYAQQLIETRKRLGDIERLDRQRAAHMSRQASIQGRIDDVRSGRFGQRMASEASLSRFEQTVRAAEQRVMNQQKYGRTLGGVVSGVQGFAGSAVGQGATALGGAGFGLAMRGFQGTVEMNRFNTELTLVSRELAATVKPALELATEGLKGLRSILEGLGTSGQNLVGAFIALTGATIAYKTVMTGLSIIGLRGGGGGAWGGAILSGATGGLMGGGRGAVSGGAMNMAAMAGTAGVVRSGPANAGRGGMGGILPVAGRAGLYGLIAAGLVSGLSSPTGRREMAGDLGAGPSTAGYAGDIMSSNPLALINDTVHGRRPGIAGLAARAGEDLGIFSPAFANRLGGESYRSSRGGINPDGSRRSVMQEGAGFEGVGSAYERISDAAANVYAGERGGRSDAELIAAMQRLTDAFNRSEPGDAVVRAMRGR